MVDRLTAAAAIGDIPKLAVMPRRAADVAALLAATAEAKERLGDRPIVTMSMSGIGAVSRFAGETFGSALTFGSVKATSAPGQIPVEKLRIVLDIAHGAF
jgi:3-dehydroquinate dehydratase-1